MQQFTPEPRRHHEKIGEKDYVFEETRLDVFDHVTLWTDNPRLIPLLADPDDPDGGLGTYDDSQLEEKLRRTPNYAELMKSLKDIGQMEPIYAWKKRGAEKYLVIEGATRVTALRELARSRRGKPDESQFRFVDAKKLPEEFTETEMRVLLAKIHVRGSGVRPWGRYVEAKFIYETVSETNGKAPLLSSTDLARYMGKSLSWVTRLKDAYAFAMHYVEHHDDAEAKKEIPKYFSVLEEVSKSTGFGPRVREYGHPESDRLRGEVFDMVRAGVFKEYRDARFMKDFYDDPEKWALLKTKEKEIGHRLASEIKAGASNLKGRIGNLPAQIEKALERESDAVGETELEALQQAADIVEARIVGADRFRFKVRELTEVLYDAGLRDVIQVTDDDLTRLDAAIADVRHRRERAPDAARA